MSERELRAEIVRSGKWLYDGAVPFEVWIVRQNFEYWFVEAAAAGAESILEGKVEWTDHRNSKLFGGRRYSIVPVDE